MPDALAGSAPTRFMESGTRTPALPVLRPLSKNGPIGADSYGLSLIPIVRRQDHKLTE